MNSELRVGIELGAGLSPGEVVASRYVVEGLWRNHPLGEIYDCRDLDSNDHVLVQRLRKEFADPEVAERLFETHGQATLGSTRIPEILDYGTDFDGRPFVVGRAHGGVATLAELERPIAFVEAVELVMSVAEALIPAHTERLVHGGLEPTSILVDRDADLRPRVVAVLGFGLVPALERGRSRARSLPLLMTPTHVAPELVRGAPISPAADVYALGILLWELIHGAPPFRGPTLRVLDAHANRALPVRELPFDVPPSFDWVLHRMLNKDPVDRFCDAAMVVAQLRPFAATPTMPDLTSDLDEDPPERSATPAALDEDDERTIVWDRHDSVGPEPVIDRHPRAITVDPSRVPQGWDAQASAAPALEASLPSVELELPLAPTGAPRWAKPAALGCLGLLLALLGAQWLIGAQRGPASASAGTGNEDPSQLAASIEPRGTQTAVEPTPEPPPVPEPTPATPSTVALELVEPAGPETLASEAFRAAKGPLYAAVEGRCVSDQMRRTVKLAVRVDDRGEVDSATVLGPLAGTGLGRCVEQEAGELRFPTSAKGGYYVYTLRLR